MHGYFNIKTRDFFNKAASNFCWPFARLAIKSETELLLGKLNRIITETKEKECVNTARCAFPKQ